jgi:hypothetical protein
MKTILLTVLTICAAVAQGLTEPPPLLCLHRSLGAGSIRPYSDNHISVDVVGMRAVTGRPETWLNRGTQIVCRH